MIGRISLDDIRRALDRRHRDRRPPTLEWHLAGTNGGASPNRLRNDIADDARSAGGGRSERPFDRRPDRSIDPARPGRNAPYDRAMSSAPLLDAFISGWISSKGPYVKKFEEDFSRFVGVRHGVAVSNGTVALHLALVALGIGPGDEVIVPDLTFAATINAVLYCGATPVIVDVDRQTWCMSLESMKRACTARTKAIIPVHLYGRPAEIGPIADFRQEPRHRRGRGLRRSARRALRAAERSGSSATSPASPSTPTRSSPRAKAACASPTRTDLAKSLRVLRDHGMSPDRSYWHERVGYNYRITNLQAAIGQSQLWRVNEVLQRNARIASPLPRGARGHPGRALSAGHARRVRTCGVDGLRAGAGRQAPAADARGPRGQDRDAALLPSPRPCRRTANMARACPNSIELSATGVNLPTSRAVDEQVVERVARVFHDVLALTAKAARHAVFHHHRRRPRRPGTTDLGRAARDCCPDWLDRGVAVVERQAHLGGTLGRFGIHSDLAGRFLPRMP